MPVVLIDGVEYVPRVTPPAALAIEGARDPSTVNARSSVTRDAAAVTVPGTFTQGPGTGGVLSIYTGLGLLDRAFEEVGYVVDSAGDLQWGRPIQGYRGRLGSHEGIIAGPPCQTWSSADPCRTPKHKVDFSADSTHAGVVTLRELLRVIDEVQPEWWLAECVPGVPDLIAVGYHVQRLNITDAECGGRQRRIRAIQFGSRIVDRERYTVIRPRRVTGAVATARAVLASKSEGDESHFRRHCQLMGLSSVPDLSAFTKAARFRLVGNGVPLTMGRVLARAVTERGPVTDLDCVCGCGQPKRTGSQYSDATNATCRQRVCRRQKVRWEVSLPELQERSA